MAFNGTNWVSIGNPRFSEGIIFGPDLAFDPRGSVYIAYPETYSAYYPCDYYLTVLKNDSVNIAIEEKVAYPLSIFPNPVGENVTIRFPNLAFEHADIALYNLLGRKVAELKTRQGEVQLNLDEIPSGTYVVEVKTSRFCTFGKVCKY